MAVCASAVASQLADATDFHLASGFGNHSLACLVTSRATGASPAASAVGAATTDCIFKHRESDSMEIELRNNLYIVRSIKAIKNPSV